MKVKLNFLSALFSFVLFAQIASAQDTTGLAIQQNKFEKIMKKKSATVLDVRTNDEYKSGYIGNAVNYNVLDSLGFVNKISSLDKNKKYLLYCKSGRRSGKALVMMKNMGFKKVYHLKGGITDWKGKINKPE
jgi:rhodanese-related sulfurtransferase